MENIFLFLLAENYPSLYVWDRETFLSFNKLESLEANVLYIESQSLNISKRMSSNPPFIDPETYIPIKITNL